MKSSITERLIVQMSLSDIFGCGLVSGSLDRKLKGQRFNSKPYWGVDRIYFYYL